MTLYFWLPVMATASSAVMAPVAKAVVAWAFLIVTLYAFSVPTSPETFCISMAPFFVAISATAESVELSRMTSSATVMSPLMVPFVS